MDSDDLVNRVKIDPLICGGTPCIRGTRIPITIVIDSVAEGMKPEELIEHYPSLKLEDVPAALYFASRVIREKYEPADEWDD
jgi:uncharacterized protein (DUF433 family)